MIILVIYILSFATLNSNKILFLAFQSSIYPSEHHTIKSNCLWPYAARKCNNLITIWINAINQWRRRHHPSLYLLSLFLKSESKPSFPFPILRRMENDQQQAFRTNDWSQTRHQLSHRSRLNPYLHYRNDIPSRTKAVPKKRIAYTSQPHIEQ